MYANEGAYHGGAADKLAGRRREMRRAGGEASSRNASTAMASWRHPGRARMVVTYSGLSPMNVKSLRAVTRQLLL